MAEAIFSHLVREAGLHNQIEIDSTGTGAYHLGEPAHRGTRQILSDHGIQYVGRARQVRGNELRNIDYIIPMDSSNLRDIQRIAPDEASKERMQLMLHFATNTKLKDVPDPYFTGDFEETYQLISNACTNLLAFIREKEGI